MNNTFQISIDSSIVLPYIYNYKAVLKASVDGTTLMQLQQNPPMYFLKYKQLCMFLCGANFLVQLNDALATFQIQFQSNVVTGVILQKNIAEGSNKFAGTKFPENGKINLSEMIRNNHDLILYITYNLINIIKYISIGLFMLQLRAAVT